MALEQRLQLKQTTRLIMTPQLQQAIKLLQMSKLDLMEELHHELEENPALEEGNLEGSQEEPNPETEEASEAPEGAEDFDVEKYLENLEGDYAPPRSSIEVREDLPSFEQTLSKRQNLYDHLTWQLNLTYSADLNREIGRAFIGNVDEDGYLEASVLEVAAMGNWPPTEVARGLQVMQGFDPAGVFARDLQECLLLQVGRLELDDTRVEPIIREHLDQVRARKYPEIAKALGCSLEEIYAAVEILKGLDPKPGRKYSQEEPRYVLPDVVVVKDGDKYRIVLNDDGMPRLRLSPAYGRMLRSLDRQKAKVERDYVKEKVSAALRLIKSIEERQRTIYKVARSIVKYQRGFLDHGVQELRPLILRDVADDIGMHESTVSRVVNNKYMHTPRGILEMRYFFHSGIHTSQGQDMSSLAVKQKISRLIEREESRKPLSDAAIVALLGNLGIKIARRTVAKYREELRIPSSSERRKAALGP